MPRSARPVLKWFGDKAIDFVLGEVGKRMDAAGAAAVAYARALAPVDTGALRNSIGYIYRQDTRTLTIYADVHYSAYQEFGTYKMDAHPYIRPAIEEAGRVIGATTAFAFPNSPGFGA